MKPQVACLTALLGLGLAGTAHPEPRQSDAALERQWLAFETECRGGAHVPQDKVCIDRDHIEALLASRGVCWAYSDVRVYPQDYRWHPCSVARPKGWKPD